LRHVLMLMEGYYVSGYNGEGDTPETELELVPGAVEDAERFLEELPDTQRRFKRVDELVDGFESPFGLELLSTVHWVAKHEGALGKDNVVSQVYAWSDRKKQFTHQQITLAWEVLLSKGWI